MIRNVDYCQRLLHRLKSKSLISRHHAAALWNDVDTVRWRGRWLRTLNWQTAMCSRVTSYCLLSLLTWRVVLARSPSYSSPVHDARRSTHNDHNRRPTTYTYGRRWSLVGRRRYLRSAPTTRWRHCHLSTSCRGAFQQHSICCSRLRVHWKCRTKSHGTKWRTVEIPDVKAQDIKMQDLKMTTDQIAGLFRDFNVTAKGSKVES